MTSLASRVGWAVAAAALLTAGCAAAGLSAGAWSVSGGAGVLWSCCGCRAGEVLGLPSVAQLACWNQRRCAAVSISNVI